VNQVERIDHIHEISGIVARRSSGLYVQASVMRWWQAELKKKTDDDEKICDVEKIGGERTRGDQQRREDEVREDPRRPALRNCPPRRRREEKETCIGSSDLGAGGAS